MLEKTRAEDGATAVLVAICLLLLVGAGAIAIDLGSAWTTKRSLVVDTDSAALAGARVLADPGGDCAAAEVAAAEFLSANLGESVTPAQLKSGSGGSLVCVTPGIRPVENREEADQKRIMTPTDAIRAGADYLVVGRPVRDAADPRATAEAIVAEIKAAAA